MSVSGLCGICQAAEASHRCENCGSLVCEEHFVVGEDRCVQCAELGGGRRI